MAYDTDNIFAKILRGEIPSHKIYEDDHSLAFLDVMPQTKGHALVVPKEPSENLLVAKSETLGPLMVTVQKIAQASLEAFQADGVLIQQFNHEAAGQTVFHTHFHIVPRYEGIALKRHREDMESPEILSQVAESYLKVLG